MFTFHSLIQVRFWDIIMQILDGFFRVKPENIGFATCMKNIGLCFASSDIFHTCSSSNIFRYHPQAIQYCIIIGQDLAYCWSLVFARVWILTKGTSHWQITAALFNLSSNWGFMDKIQLITDLLSWQECGSWPKNPHNDRVQQHCWIRATTGDTGGDPAYRWSLVFDNEQNIAYKMLPVFSVRYFTGT